MSYKVPPTPHATYSSLVNQGVASTTTAYPVLFETIEDEAGVYQKTSTVTIDIATPAVINWSGHGLSVGAAVLFTTTGALPTGITANTVYYIIATGFGVNSFQISATLGGTAINTSGTQSGVHTCRCVSRFYVPESGHYLVSISGLVDTTSNTASLMDIWFDQNGTNIVNSNTQVAVNSNGIQAVLAVPLIFDLEAGDYIRIFYAGSNTNIRLLAIGAQSNPTRPNCPSMIVAVNKISR